MEMIAIPPGYCAMCSAGQTASVQSNICGLIDECKRGVIDLGVSMMMDHGEL